MDYRRPTSTPSCREALLPDKSRMLSAVWVREGRSGAEPLDAVTALVERGGHPERCFTSHYGVTAPYEKIGAIGPLEN